MEDGYKNEKQANLRVGKHDDTGKTSRVYKNEFVIVFLPPNVEKQNLQCCRESGG